MDQVKNIYRKQDIEKIEKKISYLGLDVKEKKNKLYAYIVKDAQHI
jgi:hypothetical protein